MSLWDQLCSDLHLYDISRLIAEWRDIAPALGLTEVEENTVMRDVYTQPAQRLAMLRTWKKKHGVLATYKSLADAFTRCGRQDLVDIVTDLVRETSNTSAADGSSSVGTASPMIPTHSKHSCQHHSPSTSPSPLSQHSRLDKSLNALVQAPSSPPATKSPFNVTGSSLAQAHQHSLLSVGADSSMIPSLSKHSHQQSPSTSPSSLPTQCSRLGDESYNVSMPASSSPPATTLSVSSSAPAHQHSISPAMQQYLKFIKNYYNSKKTPVYDKESSLLHFKCKSFVNIALVHKDSGVSRTDSEKSEMLMDKLHGHVDVIQKKKTKLRMCDVCMCENGRPAQCVLVEGAPGIGKTTFAYELCKLWARGEILQGWQFLVIIKLRDHRIRTAQNMYDLLYHPRLEVQQAVVDELIEEDGKGMLLILDGYDELTDSQKESTSVIQQIMSRELLCQSTLMVNSRPLATRTLHDNFVQSIDQHIEVLGFTEKNIEEYIQSACGEKPELVEDFKSYLSCHPFSSALMFNPLQCAIVTDLYRSHWERGDKGFAPKTLTELYTGLVHIMLLRYLTQHPVYKDRYWRIKDLSDLPEEVGQQLKVITELAAEGIKKRQYVFDVFDGKFPPETLGFLQIEEAVTPGIGISISHNFLHLTLQEYLAAVNYSQQYSIPEQLSQLLKQNSLFRVDLFFEYYGKKRELSLHLHSSAMSHWPVLLFMSGRTKLSGVSPNIFRAGLQNRKHYNFDVTEVEISLLHLLYETQSPQLIQSTLVTSRKYLSVSGSSALDWFVIGYCIANSTSTWRLEKKGNDSPKYLDKLVMGLRLGPEEHSGEFKIGSLLISGHWTGNWKILLQLQPYAKSVTEIKLVANQKREQCDLEKCKRKSVSDKMSPCYPMLEMFSIENVEICYSTSLLSFISQHSNLHILSMKQCNLSGIATSSLIHFLQSPNNRLQLQLTLDDCTIQIPYHTDSINISNYQLKLTLSIDNGNSSLEITGSLYVINYMLSQPDLFNANALAILKVTIETSGTTDSLQTPLYPNLVTLEIISKSTTYLHSFPFSPHENSLCTFSLTRCYLSCECVSSLVCFLLSPNNGLHELTLDDCSIQIPDHSSSVAVSYQMKLNSTLSSGTGSLKIAGSLYAIRYMLSQPTLFYTNSLTILNVTILSGTTDSLQIDTSSYPNLEELDITSEEENHTLLNVLVHIISQQNILDSLSFKRCALTCDTIRSLQSLHSGLIKLKLDDCLFDHIHTTKTSIKLNMELLDDGNVSLELTGYCCDISHWLSQLSCYTQLTKLLILHLEGQDSTTDDTLQEILLYHHHMLESLKIDSSDVDLTYLPPSIPQFIGSQQNNLHILSLSKCTLSSDVTRSLIHSLQSPYCKLYKLTMDHCTFSTHDETQQNIVSTKNNTTLCSLVITDSLCVLNHILSNVLFSKMKKICLSINITSYILYYSSAAEVLTKIPVSCPVLETVKMHSLSLPLSIPQFIGSQQNNLHTLSLRMCSLSSDVTRSLIHSIQSPHCRLHKLVLHHCTIPPTDHTQLTTAIISSTTITHLFVNETPSLTALASGLKHNTTIEQLAVDMFPSQLTKGQLRVLIDAVDTSAVQKLWLNDCIYCDYKQWFSDCPFSRKDVDIDWYNYSNLYKW